MEVRLSEKEIKVIQKAFRECFGEGKLWLFGSRADINKKGGDIDLYIEKDSGTISKLIDCKIKFKVAIKMQLGDQKIDVVLNRIGNSVHKDIYDEAKNTGVRLV